MIYTVTLNPSIDYVIRLDNFTPGITNRVESEEYYFGGKGINVSCVLAQLDINSTVLGFVAGFTGEAIENGVKHERITTDFIKLSQGNSRINIKIKTATETEINGCGPNVSEYELDTLIKKLERLHNGDTLVLAGSIPNTLPDDVYERILETLKDKDIKIVVDAAKDLLVKSLKYKPFLIKPNRQEISEIFGVDINTQEDAEKYAKELRKMGARNVLVSLDGDGAVLIDENGKKYTANSLEGHVINTVGSGDSMVAGFIAGYEKENSYSYALMLGTVCANATAFLPGLATKEKINELMKTDI